MKRNFPPKRLPARRTHRQQVRLDAPGASPSHAARNLAANTTTKAHEPDSPKPHTRAREGQRLSSGVDARAHPSFEPDVQAASAAQLEGEELWGTATSSEQAAAPSTPSSFFLTPPPSVTPADSEATEPAPRLLSEPKNPPVQPRKSTRTLTPSCIEHDAHSGGTVHAGTNAPHFSHGQQAPGAFVKAPDEAGGVTTEGDSARAPLKDPDDAELTVLACLRRKRMAPTGRPWRGLLRRTQPHARRAKSRKSSANRAPSTTSTPTRRWPASQPTPGRLTGRPSSGSSTTSLTHTTRCSHTSRQAAHRGAMQMQTQTRPAAPPRTDTPYRSVRSLSTAAPPPHPRICRTSPSRPRLRADPSQRRTVTRRRRGFAAPTQLQTRLQQAANETARLCQVDDASTSSPRGHPLHLQPKV